MSSQHFLGVSLLVAIAVWSVWLTTNGFSKAISNLIVNWEVALTMAFGSMVAGGTSMGGGAVAFPVFTKVLHVPPYEAKIFSLVIQSVGMSAASLTIIAMRTRVEWRFIRWASLGGIPGIVLGSFFLAPVLPPDAIKFFFTMMVSSFGIILFFLNCSRRKRNLAIPFWGRQEQLLSILVGFLGGIISSLVGSGMDIFCFSVMVLLFGLCEKVSTPTSVILMAINALVGFILHTYVIGDFIEPVVSYWLAAVPVVVVGAPLGAILCSLLKRKTIAKILIGLIFVESLSSFLLIPLNASLIYFSSFVFILFSSIYYWMYRSKLYVQNFNAQREFLTMTIAKNCCINKQELETDSKNISNSQLSQMSPESLVWRVRGLRGATTVSRNSAEAIAEAVDELLTAIEERNLFSADEIVSVVFSVTQNLDAIFPAAIARRRPGWEYVPLLDVQQSPVVGSLDNCIRVLIHLNTCLPQKGLNHIYLHQAARLRPDLTIAN